MTLMARTDERLRSDGVLEHHALPDVPRTSEDRVDVLEIARRLNGTLLESAPSAPGTGRYSYVVASAAGRLIHRGTRTSLRLATGDVVDVADDPFDAVDEVATLLGCQPQAAHDHDDAPFTSGLVGFFGADLAHHVERLERHAPRDRSMPDLDLLLADAVVVIDHAVERASLRRRQLVQGLAPRSATQVLALLDQSPAPVWEPTTATDVVTTLPRAEYLATIREVLDRIGRGDIFQANIGQRLSASWGGDLASLYAAMRAASPAPLGAMHTFSDGSGIASISPETFVILQGREIQTRPIKGTRPRDADRAVDEQLRSDLLASAKDRAENIMIVDLLRNDLGRICVPGTIHVPELFAAEAHPTVWQLVSTVRGWLRRDTTVGDVLRATFPCGSVTGAPKISAMQIIERLEPVGRGAWCGAFGFIAPGAMSTSVTIRTAALANGIVDYAAGGGIVADSDPEAEVEESWAKAQSFLRAVRGSRPSSDA